jgi:NAD(P)-dependent dehydrogenase (short-subunit alcohol dehydrogenase family)
MDGFMDPTEIFRLEGRTAMVTGASSGLGAHFAKTLAGAGAKLILAARRMEKLQKLADQINADGGMAVPVALDVSDPSAVACAFDDAEAALGPVAILVNNAGVPSSSWFLDVSEEEWRRVMDVNLDGVFRVGQEAARRMKAAGQGGSIVNIASITGVGALVKRLAPYAVSKAAVVQLTKVMALELARENIRVNALAPGYFATEMNESHLSSEAGKRLVAGIPQARVGELHELDGALLLLASDAGSFMTGAVIAIDGGALLSIA